MDGLLDSKQIKIKFIFICFVMSFMNSCFYYARGIDFQYNDTTNTNYHKDSNSIYRFVQKDTSKNLIALDIVLYRKPLFIYFPLMALEHKIFYMYISIIVNKTSSFKINRLIIYDKYKQVVFKNKDTIYINLMNDLHSIKMISDPLIIDNPFNNDITINLVYEDNCDKQNIKTDSLLMRPLKKNIQHGIGIFMGGIVLSFNKNQ